MDSVPRIIVPVKPHQRSVELEGELFHYIRNVLRLRQGQPLLILDGKGGIYEAVIKDLKNHSVAVSITGPSSEPLRESPVRVVILQAILKSRKMDLVLQKGTELGVAEFWPVVTQRSEVRWTRKLHHWRAVVREATRQCRRAVVPEVREPVNFEEALNRVPAGAVKLLLSEKGSGERPPGELTERIFLAVGPEGGFSEQEEQLAKQKGFVCVGLGPRILRAETAALVGCTIVQFLYGDITLGYHYCPK